jgi:O-antigen ligase
MWAGAEMFLEHPLVGVGTGDFAPAMEALQQTKQVTATPGTRNDSAANSYLSEAAVLGLPGLFFLVWFLFRLSREAWIKRWTPQSWFVLTYLGIFWIGGFYNTLIWGYADALSIAIFAGMPLDRDWTKGQE